MEQSNSDQLKMIQIVVFQDGSADVSAIRLPCQVIIFIIMGQLLVKKKVENLKNLVIAPSPFVLSVFLQRVGRLFLWVSVSARCDRVMQRSTGRTGRRTVQERAGSNILFRSHPRNGKNEQTSSCQ